jgi:hypothetical protein
MHDDLHPQWGGLADDPVRRAREQFDDAIELLALTKTRLKHGDAGAARDVASQVALVLKALIALGEAKGRIDGLVCGAGGGVLDLDAARSEVGSRLDRLRAAGDA